MKKEYYAFISYSHKDEEWAKWVQHEFEHYHLPTTLNGLPNLPEKFHPIFRDVDELSGGELKPQISRALRASAYLVIICSPNSARSPYVNGEIQEFIEIGKQAGIDNISNMFPFIIGGVPHSNEEPDKECFPETLRNLPSELIAGDVTKHGREHAFVKILAGTLHHSQIGFGLLWNQFERDRIEEERRERERLDRLLLLESRYLSEKALDIAPLDSRLAKMLLLRALPKNLNDPNDRPYCPEAESALRRLCIYKSAIFDMKQRGRLKLNPDCSRGVSILEGTVRIWDLETESQVGEPLKALASSAFHAIYSHRGKIIASFHEDCSIVLWDAETGNPIGTLKGASKDVNRAVFTHDDRLLISTDYDKTLKIWDVATFRLIRNIKVPGSNDMAIDKGDKWIALAVYERFSIVIYDLQEGKIVKEISDAHSESLSAIDFSPDGKRIVSAAFDGRLKIWDWQKGEAVIAGNVGKVRGAYAPVVNSSRYSDDGKFIVTASRDHIIRIWNAITGELHGEPLEGHADSVLSAYFSSDGRLIISESCDGTVRIWDLHPQAPYTIIGRARALPFDYEDDKPVLSPDGRFSVTTSANVLRVWDVKSKIQMGPDYTFFDDFFRVMFIKDGRGIVSETERFDYDVVFEWEPLQELIDRTRVQVRNRQFTDDEKRRYYLT